MSCVKLFPKHTGILRHHVPQKSFSTAARQRAGEVRIVEVGPRDGLQNEKNSIPLKTKIELIRRLAQTGVRSIEAGAFVAPKWVPQMANSADVLNHILGYPPNSSNTISYNFLVPNMKGLQKFLKTMEEPHHRKTEPEVASIKSPNDANVSSTTPSPPPADDIGSAPITSPQNPNEILSSTKDKHNPETTAKSSVKAVSTEISIFTAATDSFSKANTNCSIVESLEQYKPIISLAKTRNVRVRGYVSVALGCPYEGPNVAPSKVAEVTATLLEMGADEVSVADTTGMGTVPRTQELLRVLSSLGIANKDLALHFHDTYGQALLNAMVGLEHGIRTFDSSVGGLGGCPYSKGATGNVATEDLVHCLHSLGAKTGVDLDKMAEIGAWISTELGRTNDSRAGKAIMAKLSSE